jgi:ankyrin repeat protein
MSRSSEDARNRFQLGNDDLEEIERLAYSGHWDNIIDIVAKEPGTAFISPFANVEWAQRLGDDLGKIERLACSGHWNKIIDIVEKEPELMSCIFGEVKTTLLISISYFDNVEFVRYLLSRGANPNYMDGAGQSALLSTVWGAVEGRKTLPVAQALIESGANPELPVLSGCTVIDVAKLNKLDEYIELFEKTRNRNLGRK